MSDKNKGLDGLASINQYRTDLASCQYGSSSRRPAGERRPRRRSPVRFLIICHVL